MESKIKKLHKSRIRLVQNSSMEMPFIKEDDVLDTDYYDFYHFSPVGYLTVDNRGDILSANLSASVMLDIPRKEIKGKSLYSFILKEDRDILYLHLRNIFKTNRTNSCNLRIGELYGRICYTHIESVFSVLRSGRSVARMVLVNVSELKEKEDRLIAVARALGRANREKKENLALLKAILDASPIGIGIWDRDLRFLLLNNALAEISGMTIQEHIGRSLDEVFSDWEDLDKVIASWKQIMKERNPVFNVEVRGKTPMHKGQVRYWTQNWYPVTVGGRTIGIAATVVDITERRQMFEELKDTKIALEQRVKERTDKLRKRTRKLEKEIARREEYEKELKKSGEVILKEITRRRLLSKKMVTLLENDRQNIGRTLHDEVGQLLASIHMDMDLLKSHPQDGNVNLKEMIDKIQNRIQRSSEYIREISRRTRSDVLEHLGLASAIRDLLEPFENNPDIQVRTFIKELPLNIAPDKALATFRIIQECLTNIVKYADAKYIFINLSVKKGILMFSVEDDGKGFEYDSYLENESFDSKLGLAIMKERIKLVSGKLWIETSPGKGTHIFGEMPLD